MTRRMLIDALHPEETRIVIADENQIYDFDFVSATKKQLKGNIYLAKITRVEPSLQAAFVEYGGGKQGFLPFSEIHPDYYQIPVSDRQRLMQEAEGDIPEAAEEPRTETQADAHTASDAPPQTEMPLEGGAETAPAQAELPVDDSGAHPAYLTAAAIDVSTQSEEIPETHDAAEASHVETAEQAGETPQSTEGAEAKTEDTPATGEDVETLPNEDEELQARPKKNVFIKRYKIQEVIRRGQIVLVQVIKEERGNKGASLTTYLSLAGRYCVLMPNSPKDGGISRKIMSPEDRKRLKAISTELRLAKGMSAIIRTAGMDRTRAEIKRDHDYLVNLWNSIREETLKSTAPALIYEESDIIKRAIRDQYTSDIDEMLVEGEQGYEAAKEFMKLLLPSHTPKIKFYNEPTPLFYAYNVEDQLLSMHDPVVRLRSGGYLVINPTEALISIDVNSGRSTGERNIEETATKTNLEAAAEVARQLRLRDLAGLIVIDFIDMLESRNRRAVEKAMKDALKLDRAKIQIGRISPFGLLEMSRQRLRPSISETNMVQCQHCIGRGYIRSNESMSIQMIRALEKEAASGSWTGLKLSLPQEVALHLLNTKRDILRELEQRCGISIQVLVDPKLTASEFNLEKLRKQSGDRDRNSNSEQRQQRRSETRHERVERAPVEVDAVEAEEAPREFTPEGENPQRREGNDSRRSRGRRGRRGGRRDGQPGGGRDGQREGGNRDGNQQRDFSQSPPEGGNEQPAGGDNVVEITEGAENANRDNRDRGNRNRGGRGRNRWRERPPRDGQAPRENYNQGEPVDAGTESLPAFATEAPVRPEPVRMHEPVAVNAPQDSAPADPNASPKKGWWKKMIELDD